MNTDSTTRLIRILLVGFVLLAIGEAYLIATVSSKGAAQEGYTNSTQSTPVPETGTTSQSTAGGVINSTVRPMLGTVQSVSGSSLVVAEIIQKDVTKNVSVTVSGDTQIVKLGKLKDQATQEADMAAFRKYAETLAQDPQKNQDQLAHLVAPSPYVTTKISLSDIQSGDNVQVMGEPQSDGTFAAIQISDGVVFPWTVSQ